MIRHGVFVVVFLVLIGLAAHHHRAEAWVELSIDFGIMAFALNAWRPWRSPWR